MKITPGVTWASGDTVNHTQLNAFLTNATVTSGTLDQVALGANALDSLTSGTDNVGIGDDAGTALTDGHSNVIVGNDALKTADSAYNNVAIGEGAMKLGAGTLAQNVAIGAGALIDLAGDIGSAESYSNVAVGNSAGADITTGAVNVMIGASAGAQLTTDSSTNVLVGVGAMGSAVANVDGVTAIGKEALKVNTANLNTAVGYKAGFANTSGDDNTYVGSQAGYTNITGTDNTFIGDNAGFYVTAGTNTVVGSQAGANVAGGGGNTLLGYGSGGSLTGGSAANVTVGYLAMGTSTSDVDGAIAVGHEALKVNTASFNTAVGYEAGLATTSGDDNTYLGSQVGITNITGADNTFIGDNAGYYVTGSQNTALGSGAFVESGDAALANTTALGYGANPTVSNQIQLGNGSISNLRCADDTVATDSDERIKKNVKNNKIGLAFINALRTVSFKKINPYNWPDAIKESRFKGTGPDGKMEKKPADDKMLWHGLIAQEVEEVMKEQGIKEWRGHRVDPNGMQNIGYGSLVVPLVKAVQELAARVVKLEGKA